MEDWKRREEDVERGGWEIERFRGDSFKISNHSILTTCRLTSNLVAWLVRDGTT